MISLYKKGNSDLDRQIITSLKSNHLPVRIGALRVIAEAARLSESLPALQAALKSSDAREQRQAMIALTSLGPTARDAISSLNSLCRSETTSGDNQIVALKAIGVIGAEDRYIADFLRALLIDESALPDKRTEAAYGLGCSKHGDIALNELLSIASSEKYGYLVPGLRPPSKFVTLRSVALWAIARLHPTSKNAETLFKVFRSPQVDDADLPFARRLLSDSIAKAHPASDAVITGILSELDDPMNQHEDDYIALLKAMKPNTAEGVVRRHMAALTDSAQIANYRLILDRHFRNSK
jgi:hypothetical protein